MSGKNPETHVPQDLVAIFHASFHPTQGNVVDWSLKASDDLSLDHLEFSALPSGLHLVEQDVIYFTKDGQYGVCVFRRRKTTEQGHRGFRLTSLGILLAKSQRPRPWRHIEDLKQLIDSIYSITESVGRLQPSGRDWDLAQEFFEQRKVRRADLGGAGDWNGWSEEFDRAGTSLVHSPTLHLPHLLRILGPSSLTLYKHVLGRQRILFYTLPPVEAACILCQVAADMCLDVQVRTEGRRFRGRNKDPISVLGMVTLSDLDRLHAEEQTGRGWIACTTDAIFMEKPSYYDLLIDLTTSTPNKATRPSFYCSKPINPPPANPKSPTHHLSTIRFSWSDIRLWNEMERIPGFDADPASCCGPSASDTNMKSKLISTWTDAWRVYEDVCVICAGLWMGSWRNNSTMSYSTANGPENWGAVRLEGDDDLTLSGTYVRNVGMGIEGGPKASSGGGIGNTMPSKSHSRLSSSSRITTKSSSSGKGAASNRAQHEPSVHHEETVPENSDGQMLTTMALLQTLHAHSSFQISVLESFLPKGISSRGYEADHTLYLTPKDILAFELGPLSGLDARYLEWLVKEYAEGMTLVVKRSWKDLFGALFGYS